MLIVLVVPNNEFFTFGDHNQFHGVLFFPELICKDSKGTRYVNYVMDVQFKRFWENVFIPALTLLELYGDEEGAKCIRILRQDIRDSYSQTKGRNHAGWFNHRSIPIPRNIVNVLFQAIRLMTEQPQNKEFRQFFVHIFAMGIKASTMGLHLANDTDPLAEMMEANPVVDYNALNPMDIVVDFGLEFLHDGARPSISLFNRLALQPLLYAAGWGSGLVDAYCHSAEVAGIRTQPKAELRGAQLFKLQCYHKDKSQTYNGPNNSTGGNVITDHALARSLG